MRYAHTNIVSADWKSLSEFYINTFHCKMVPPVRQQSGKWLGKGTGLRNAALEGVHLLLPGYDEKGPTLEIYQYAVLGGQEPILPNRRGFGHIAFEVEDVGDTLQSLELHGGKRLGEVTTQKIPGLGLLTFVYARDPEGNLIELQNWKKEVRTDQKPKKP